MVSIAPVDVSVGGVRSRVLTSGPADTGEAVVFVHAHDFGGPWAMLRYAHRTAAE